MRAASKIRNGPSKVVIGLSGWPNAGNVASYGVDYIRQKLDAVKIGEIDSASYYNFLLQRPIVKIEKGLLKELELPRNEAFLSRKKKGAPRVMVFSGVEPHANWPQYVKELLDLVCSGKVEIICILGGLVDASHKVLEPALSGLANSMKLVEILRKEKIQLSEYSGPGSIHSLVLSECAKRGIPALSLWGHVPEFINGTDPVATYGVLQKLQMIIGIEMDLVDLENESKSFIKKVGKLLRKDRRFSAQGLEYGQMAGERKPHYIG